MKIPILLQNIAKKRNQYTNCTSQFHYLKFKLVNFPFLSSTIPAATAYGVYISKLIRYSRACISYHEYLLTRKLLNQEFQMVKLKSFLRKFYGRHHEMVVRYGITVSQMISDMFLTSLLQSPFPFMNVTYQIRIFTGFVIT